MGFYGQAAAAKPYIMLPLASGAIKTCFLEGRIMPLSLAIQQMSPGLVVVRRTALARLLYVDCKVWCRRDHGAEFFCFF